jgi:hypothetical protein
MLTTLPYHILFTHTDHASLGSAHNIITLVAGFKLLVTSSGEPQHPMTPAPYTWPPLLWRPLQPELVSGCTLSCTSILHETLCYNCLCESTATQAQRVGMLHGVWSLRGASNRMHVGLMAASQRSRLLAGAVVGESLSWSRRLRESSFSLQVA